MLFVIYHVEGHIGVSPTILGLAWELTAAGHKVEIRTLGTDAAPSGELPAGSRALNLSPHVGQWLLSWIVTIIPAFDSVWFLWQNVLADLKIPPVERTLRRVNIGVEPRGTIVAWLCGLLPRIPLVYVSLELTAPSSYRGIKQLVPWLERMALKSARALVIQDEDRLQSFSNYHHTLPDRTFLLPNSARSRGDNSARHKDFFHTRFGLDRERFPYIALQAGQINDAVYCQELVESFETVDGFALVLHERFARPATDPYFEILRAKNSSNLFLSLSPVPFDELDQVFVAATIGLAFYRPLDENYAQVTLASGKLSFYLMHGIPVLMNALPASEKLLRQFEIGILVRDPGNANEVVSAVDTIMSRYEFYSRNARRCFEEVFDFSVRFAPLGKFLDSL